MAKSTSATPERPTLPLRRAPRAARPRPGVAPRPAAPDLPFRSERQRRWFDAEVTALSRLAHTMRLAGDFVLAQRLERELDSFIEEARALLAEGSGYDERDGAG